jgi:hypothetical protein
MLRPEPMTAFENEVNLRIRQFVRCPAEGTVSLILKPGPTFYGALV